MVVADSPPRSMTLLLDSGPMCILYFLISNTCLPKSSLSEMLNLVLLLPWQLQRRKEIYIFIDRFTLCLTTGPVGGSWVTLGGSISLSSIEMSI